MPRYHVRITGQDYDAMADLVRKYKITVARHTVEKLKDGYRVDAHANGTQIRRLEAAGYKVERIEDADQAGKKRQVEFKVASERKPTRNAVWIFDTFPNIGYFIDVHSYSEAILCCWGDDVLQTTDVGLATRMREAIKAVRGREYRVEQAIGLYPTAGTSDDYAFSRHITDSSKPKIYSYTIEWGSPDNPTPFHPPYREMRNIIQEITAALLEFCWRAGA